MNDDVQYHLEALISELRGDVAALTRRVEALEADTPQARQLQYEADVAAADLAASGYSEGWGDW